MLRKYAPAAVIALLVVAWSLAFAASYVHLDKSVRLAEAVARSSGTLQQELDNPREELITSASLPENRIVDAVKTAWSEGMRLTTYPPDALGSPAVTPRVR